jgi:hypothetical protein
MFLTVGECCARRAVQVYERAAIEDWLKDKETAPITGARLESKKLISCIPLRQLIQQWSAGALSLNRL